VTTRAPSLERSVDRSLLRWRCSSGRRCDQSTKCNVASLDDPLHVSHLGTHGKPSVPGVRTQPGDVTRTSDWWARNGARPSPRRTGRGEDKRRTGRRDSVVDCSRRRSTDDAAFTIPGHDDDRAQGFVDLDGRVQTIPLGRRHRPKSLVPVTVAVRGCLEDVPLSDFGRAVPDGVHERVAVARPRRDRRRARVGLAAATRSGRRGSCCSRAAGPHRRSGCFARRTPTGGGALPIRRTCPRSRGPGRCLETARASHRGA
jgi:hypothetical protein